MNHKNNSTTKAKTTSLKKNAQPIIRKRGNVVKKPVNKASKTDSKIKNIKQAKKEAEAYPVIYSYIYDREPQDIERLFNSVKVRKAKIAKVTKITGFAFVNGEVKAVVKSDGATSSSKTRRRSISITKK